MTLSAARVRSTPPAMPLFAAVLLVVAVLLAALPPNPVQAAPGTAGPEGGSASLRDQLDAAARGFNDAAARLDASKARQVQLADQMRVNDVQLAQLTEQVGALAASAYKGGRVGGLVALLDSGSPDSLFQRATTLESKARIDDGKLRRLKEAKAAQRLRQTALDGEVKDQQGQLAEMDKRKKAAEKALASVGSGQKTQGLAGGAPAAAAPAQPGASTNPNGSGGAGAPVPAPRRADGTFASESCSVKDPTTSGCLTPRTLHALQQTQAAGFNHFVSCYRSQEDGGEHPRGRACDFAAAPRDFGGVATGADKDYGNRLAAWYIANSKALGVLYVIWFKQIWLPSTGWRAYTNGNGTPSGDHTNHVHLSVQ
ncbi:MAG: hypothetical protein JWP76_5415 [Dactylosporangium sp.]|nr:hypothetical protein [Dactylosporangium sp.]